MHSTEQKTLDLFLPYQKRYLNDKSRYKLTKKSRRTGFTWTQSFEDVIDAATLKIKGKPVDVWYTSADSSAGVEYIRYCAYWARAMNFAFNLEETAIIDDDGFKTYSLEFNSGARITALSSNPKALRSKGGKVVIDEFAFHDNPRELWKAAKPVIAWGYPLRIISSLNGTNNLFYHFTKQIEKGKLKWSMFDIPIQLAVEEGLVDKILGHKATEEEKAEWLNNEKEGCADNAVWLQEYCCVAVDENSAFLTFDLLKGCAGDTLIDDLDNVKGELYIGYDIARHKDLSVISVFEKLGSVFYLRKIVELHNVPYRMQKEFLYKLLSHPKLVRCAIDATGLGNNLAEDAQIDFGKRKVDMVTFTNKTKEELAYQLLYTIQDNNIRFPLKDEILNDLHSIKKILTSTGATRFDASRSETDGHADRFWSFALAVWAGASEIFHKPEIYTRNSHKNDDFADMFNLRGPQSILRRVGF